MNKVDLSKFDNSWYNPGGKFKLVLWYLINSFFFDTYISIGSSLKSSILRLFGAKVGKGVVIKPKVKIKYPWNLEIGNHTWIGEHVWIDCLDEVKIGDNVCVSQGALLLSGNHDYKKSTFDLILKGIILEDGVWVGAKSVVTQGVICHSHSVLSVLSVASKNLDSYSIYAGNPAERLRDREINF
jgi:putative colanic acid biosynthesis acetyltransferase WcaF